MLRDFRIQARPHGFFVALELAGDLGFPLVGMRLDALVGEFFVNLQGGFVETEFDDRKIGRRGLKIIAEAQMGELQFGLVEIGKRFAEVDEHEVALVSEEREEGGLAGGIFLHGGERVGGFFGDCRSFRLLAGLARRASVSASSGAERCSLR